MKQQLHTMLELQDSMNSKVHADWKNQQFAWYRAIWIECGEMLDHYGWKWWKKQDPDIEQVILELIDIWHFGLSVMLQTGDSHERIANALQKSLDNPVSSREFSNDLEYFAERTLATKGFDVEAFTALMGGVSLDFDGLHRGYVGKNVLNFFRQDHGYKDGSYCKEWGGREDNEHLVEVSQRLDASLPSFKDDLYTALQQRYQELTQA